MLLRLWAVWEPAGNSRPSGYHLELDRPYGRVPMVGESIDLPRTRYGIKQGMIESINWDEDTPNLVLATWNEAAGDNLKALMDAGFHQAGERYSGCRYCALNRS